LSNKINLSPKEWDAIREVARALRFFAEERMYTYIDRIADAFSPNIAVAALKDALRALRSEVTRNPNIYLPSENSIEIVIKLLSEKRDSGNVLAALALSFRPRKTSSKVEGGGS